MNMKQRMIDAMQAQIPLPLWPYIEPMLDAALSVAADPENWRDDMWFAVSDAPICSDEDFRAIINHIKGLPS